MNKIDKAYRSIGQFVVTFQWIENKYREIGWIIIDPERKNWPPMALRTETNAKLIDKVTSLYLDLTNQYQFPNGREKVSEFEALRHEFHALRKFRNRLLHSTYIELKTGGEVLGLLRSNPKIEIDTESGEIIFDQEDFTEAVVNEKLKEVAEAAFRLGQHYLQIIHWFPFNRFPHQV